MRARSGRRDVRVIAQGVRIPDSVGEPDEPPHILYVGRLSEEKGVRELAEAAEASCRSSSSATGRSARCFRRRLGFVPPAEVGAYYERAAIVVVPSRREGYGMVAREAMAHGRPVVATAVGGLVDAVEDGVTGLLVPPRDAAALRAALERLLGDTELRRSLGAAARERVVRTASPATTAERLLEAYRAASSVGPAAQERA